MIKIDGKGFQSEFMHYVYNTLKYRSLRKYFILEDTLGVYTYKSAVNGEASKPTLVRLKGMGLRLEKFVAKDVLKFHKLDK